MSCLGCKILNEDGVKVFEVYSDENFSVVLDIAPLNEGHLLIIPKRHVKEIYELKEDEVLNLFTLINNMSTILKETFNPDGISILQNGGNLNDLGHLHFHIIPRYENDGLDSCEEKKFLVNISLEKTKNKLKEKINFIFE